MRHATPIWLRAVIAAWLTLSCAVPAWRLPEAIEPWHLVLAAFGIASLSKAGTLLHSALALRFVEDACRRAMVRSALLMALWYALRPDDATLWLMATHDTACYAWGLSRQGGWTRAALALFVLLITPSVARTGAICQMPWEPLARGSLLTLCFTEMADALAR
jgi:hypothetical protein